MLIIILNVSASLDSYKTASLNQISYWVNKTTA